MSNACEFQELRVGITDRPSKIMGFDQHWPAAGTLTERVLQSYYRAAQGTLLSTMIFKMLIHELFGPLRASIHREIHIFVVYHSALD